MRADAGQQGEGKASTHRAAELEQQEPAHVYRSCCSCKLSLDALRQAGEEGHVEWLKRLETWSCAARG